MEVCELMYTDEGDTLPCEVALAAGRKDMVASLHIGHVSEEASPPSIGEN